MNKFTFYNDYLKGLNKLNPFQFKKIVNALAAYAADEVIPDKLSHKALIVFGQIQRVINAEKELERKKKQCSEAGKKGMKKRWNNG